MKGARDYQGKRAGNGLLVCIERAARRLCDSSRFHVVKVEFQ